MQPASLWDFSGFCPFLGVRQRQIRRHRVHTTRAIEFDRQRGSGNLRFRAFVGPAPGAWAWALAWPGVFNWGFPSPILRTRLQTLHACSCQKEGGSPASNGDAHGHSVRTHRSGTSIAPRRAWELPQGQTSPAAPCQEPAVLVRVLEPRAFAGQLHSARALVDGAAAQHAPAPLRHESLLLDVLGASGRIRAPWRPQPHRHRRAQWHVRTINGRRSRLAQPRVIAVLDRFPCWSVQHQGVHPGMRPRPIRVRKPARDCR